MAFVTKHRFRRKANRNRESCRSGIFINEKAAGLRSPKQVLQARVLDFNALVTQVAEMLPPVLGADITLKLDLDPDLGRVKADPAQLEQVIMNLVFNARDAMPDGGELTIETSNCTLDDEWVRSHPEVQSGPYVRLGVRDTGHGMDEETQSHLFEPFFTTKDKSRGTGLGMATVHGTVNQSGGCVTVSSKLGSGTTIQIYLPRVVESIETVESRSAAGPFSRWKRKNTCCRRRRCCASHDARISQN